MKIAHDVIDHIRYTAVLDGKKIHMLYARPDDDRPWTGDIYGVSVMRYAASQRAYFLDVGNGTEMFLPHKDAKKFSTGTKILVRVERPQTKEKSIRASLVEDTASVLGLIEKGDDDVMLAKKDFPHATETADGLQDFDAAIIALQNPTVFVQQGVEIVIEHTAALTAVDINNADPDLKPFEANRLCMTELLRQMRLRNLSGQILADCLRLQNPEQKIKLIDHVKEHAAQDPCAIDLYGFTRLGLLELTREKRGLPLKDVLAIL